MGVIATAAGADGVLRGAGAVRRGGPLSADVDSEFRFFAAWYAAAGLSLLDAARAPEEAARAVRMSCGGLLFGALGRALSIKRFGRPSPLYRILMGIEIALPMLLIVWHRGAVGRVDAGKD
ncbi:MAG: hypothetical protein QOF21_66 [Actinomycetota bacterium]|jgi:hypothetical protein